ncbi:unnamed protein product [Onchocerca flexuosa]|uniref:Neuro_bHLH domain-containing protein n=1 Tax=Onchocerca flexuosa TaxID=387005 RepID=A0A183HXN7_9BILA|nr:unnamed protein product [Onchocerca flexuosa]
MLSNGMSQTTTNLIATLLHVPPRLLALTQQQQQQRYRRSTYYHQEYRSYLEQDDHHSEYNPIRSTINDPECSSSIQSSHLNQHSFMETFNLQQIESNQPIPIQLSTSSKLHPTSNMSTNTVLPLLPIGFHL